MMQIDEKWLLEEKYGGDASAPGFATDRKRLTKGEPLAYIIGSQPFLGLDIFLDSRPLIPRPETEWWTERLLAAVGREGPDIGIFGTLRRLTGRAGGNSPAGEYSVPKNTNVRPQISVSQNYTTCPTSFLDLCAGSGAIGCAALARLLNTQVYFGDIDPRHEATIRKNIRENALDEGRADIRTGDLFAPFKGLRFDTIAANPPYIPSERSLPESVSSYEPAEALYAGKDGLAVIRRILDALPEYLAPGGTAWIECDESNIEEALALAKERGLTSSILADQYGKPRVLCIEA